MVALIASVIAGVVFADDMKSNSTDQNQTATQQSTGDQTDNKALNTDSTDTKK